MCYISYAQPAPIKAFRPPKYRHAELPPDHPGALEPACNQQPSRQSLPTPPRPGPVTCARSMVPHSSLGRKATTRILRAHACAHHKHRGGCEHQDHEHTHIFAGKTVRNSSLWLRLFTRIASLVLFTKPTPYYKNLTVTIARTPKPLHRHQYHHPKRVYAPRTLATTRSLFSAASAAAGSTAAHIRS